MIRLTWLALVIVPGAAVAAAVAGPPARYRPPKAAFAPVRLQPLPNDAAARCKRMQSHLRFTIFCPARLPQATLAYPWRRGAKPYPLRVEIYGAPLNPRYRGLLGFDFGYGVPTEPQSGEFYRCCRWLNRPAYFLHFTLFRRGNEVLPRPLSRRCFGHLCGLVKYASGYGLRPGPDGFYWANHTWFFWRERGARWAASLHYFGRGETTALLARILAELRPARSLR